MEEKANYVHCVFQELESLGIALPIGDYNLVYSYLEEIREYFRELNWQERNDWIMTEWDIFIGSIIVFGLIILGIVAYLYDEEGRNG